MLIKLRAIGHCDCPLDVFKFVDSPLQDNPLQSDFNSLVHALKNDYFSVRSLTFLVLMY